MPRATPSDEIYTIAYAVSFLEAAKVVGRASDADWSDNAPLIVPFYALIGFALENSLKSALEFAKADRADNWTHSHDLNRLLEKAKQRGLILQFQEASFVVSLSDAHKEHQFRYPQKAETQQLALPELALTRTAAVISQIFAFVGGPNRLRNSQQPSNMQRE